MQLTRQRKPFNRVHLQQKHAPISNDDSWLNDTTGPHAIPYEDVPTLPLSKMMQLPDANVPLPQLQQLSLTELVNIGCLTASTANFLRSCLQTRRNILVCGEHTTDNQALLHALVGTDVARPDSFTDGITTDALHRSLRLMQVIDAMYAGRHGVVLSIEASTIWDCCQHLEMLYHASHLTLSTEQIRERIERVLDVIVHIARVKEGAWRVTRIAEFRRA